MNMAIQNIVFDVGNVLVRWDPYTITQTVFPEHDDVLTLMQSIFRHQTWLDLNLGSITEQQAILHYHQRLQIETTRLELLLQVVKESLLPIPGAAELLQRLHDKAFNLYALTDNTHDIMAYLKAKYRFWPLFKGIVVSAEIGHLKPSKEIYHYLLEHYQLNAHETLFIDDLALNVAGAKAVGIEAIQFVNTEQCIEALRDLQIDTQ
ncbi:HAD-IA family hydrolase [Candidatus Berkiella aquae]|uniref:HAD family phosphatase n=1 Tax=Candidatus Berkiella aquae TaxID=295108 RepID=A0A0Q9Z005_9GAMM|nr:HAD family phosphatase [Candidatus Berkiella aquae]MCS5712440.1 HAD family phosphatase [Candidatus Berkiella aquae]